MFVVVLTDLVDSAFVAPRAVGPFDDFDIAQAFRQTLTDTWDAAAGDPPTATVVRVEEPYPGVVVGEL
ncbi:MAG: hypothetical protein ABJB98_11990 [Actinomycetota bacterium]